MNNETHQFLFEKGDLEISLTYFYFVGHTLSSKKDLVSGHPAFIERSSTWRKTHAALNLRESFISDVIIDHFHLDETVLLDQYRFFSVKPGKDNYKFSVSAQKVRGISDDYAASIECYILKNGHAVITVKVVNEEDVDPYDSLLMIRNPELAKSQSYSEKLGEIINYIEKHMGTIEKAATEIIFENDINHKELENTYDHKIASKSNLLIRSIPYIGVIFRFSKCSFIFFHLLEHGLGLLKLLRKREKKYFLI